MIYRFGVAREAEKRKTSGDFEPSLKVSINYESVNFSSIRLKKALGNVGHGGVIDATAHFLQRQRSSLSPKR